MKSTIGLCAMTLAAAGLLLAAPVTTQAQAPSAPPTTKPKAAPADISEQKLDAAAKAVKNVSTIRDSYEQKLVKAPADQKAKLADEASDAMAKAVTDQGLSVEEYTSIIEVAQNDPAVRNKLLQRLK
jgi:membrane-bound lytic murein transglycosylase B